MIEFDSLVGKLLNKHCVNFKFKHQSRLEWAETLGTISYIPVTYTDEFIEYQLAYFNGHGANLTDISLTLYDDGRPVGVWPLSLAGRDKPHAISSYGMPVLPPLLNETLSKKTAKTIISKCFDLCSDLAQALGVETWQTQQLFEGEDNTSCTYWHLKAMQSGAIASLDHELYANLKMGLATYKQNIRRRYKSLISKGEKIWEVDVLRIADQDVWDEYRALHLEVSGRITRSLDSWQKQFAAIQKEKAFLVYLRDEHRRMVGGGYFQVSRDEAIYAVGAYDRSLFPLPLGHVVQFRAVQEMMESGISWYRLGDRPFTNIQKQPDAKHLSIADFKQGFATDTMIKINYEIRVMR